MSKDLADALGRLSLISPIREGFRIEELNAKEEDEFSSRIFLHPQSMAALGLKAGSLSHLVLEGKNLDLLLEVWPSKSTDQNVISVAGPETIKCLGLGPSHKVRIVTANRPALKAAPRIEVSTDAVLDEDSREHIIDWISRQRCLQHEQRYFIRSSSKVVHFSLSAFGTGFTPTFLCAADSSSIKFVSKESTVLPVPIIGGLDKQLRELKGIIRLALLDPRDESVTVRVKPPRGVLLYGPPGTGKTLLVSAVTESLRLLVVTLSPSDLVSQAYGESEQLLKESFQKAVKLAPSILFIDEIDSLCQNRDGLAISGSARLTTLLLALMDGCRSNSDLGGVLVLAATNTPSVLDPALRRPGRLDREIEIPPPNCEERKQILAVLLSKYRHGLSADEVAKIADACYGFVGADLMLLCKEAFLQAMSRQAQGPSETIFVDDLLAAQSRVRPSAMREVFVEVPKVRWTDIGGQHETKQKLIECVEWPIKRPEKFSKFGIKPPKGVLLYGPPGCSKTLMAKALACESGLNFLAVKGPELFSKFVGESEKNIRRLFQKARQAAPAIIFFDEFDALAGSGSSDSSSGVSSRVLSQLLVELDGLEPLLQVVIIAATNKPNLIDKALLRPGRFDRHIFVGPPDSSARLDIFKIQLSKMSVAKNVDLHKLVADTDGFTGAEIAAVCQNAAFACLKSNLNAGKIEEQHLLEALTSFRKQLTRDQLDFYRQLKLDGR